MTTAILVPRGYAAPEDWGNGLVGSYKGYRMFISRRLVWKNRKGIRTPIKDGLLANRMWHVTPGKEEEEFIDIII